MQTKKPADEKFAWTSKEASEPPQRRACRVLAWGVSTHHGLAGPFF